MRDNNDQFTQLLLQWYHPEIRPLPWKGEQNPYYIWLSEIILQQTRVEQGLPYFERFKKAYPTIIDLANAPEDELMKLWQGLGYYSRARNLHASAKQVATQYNGQFPNTYKDILTLKGVGEYTAAAIASFAYNLPHAAVDGNVYRVLSRYFGIDIPVDSTEGKKTFSTLANKLLAANQPGKYNQAIMDFGALVCKPALPLCSTCPLNKGCRALQQNQVANLPVKKGKIKVRTRFFNYLVIRHKNLVYLNKRSGKDIWKNLYDFPMVESEKLLTAGQLLQDDALHTILPDGCTQLEAAGTYKQQLTHQKINAVFFEIAIAKPLHNQANWVVVENKNLSNFAFPKIVDCYLKDKALYLNLS